ncbi:MAG: GNAT family N-acetyltransferase [Chloroflexi bacterium]|nr:MAG: GNAT family N-acetyltransferase [Chloroflexota bacterium]
MSPSRARTRRKGWPPSSRSASPTSRADRVAGPDGPARPVGGLAVRPPAGVELQPAGRDDLVTVLRLLGERESLAPPLSPQAGRDRWERIIGSVDAAPFLAIAEGEAAGLLLLLFRRRLTFGAWEGWVPELVVARTFRGRGIGRALLRVGIEEWRLRGAHRLSVETEPMASYAFATIASLRKVVRRRQESRSARSRRPTSWQPRGWWRRWVSPGCRRLSAWRRWNARSAS